MRTTSSQSCGTSLNAAGLCESCDVIPEAGDVVISKPTSSTADPYAIALREPHRLLEPL
jgi:hypothetical protein